MWTSINNNMKSKVQILSIKKNQIICKVKQRKLRLVMPLCSFLVVGFVAFFTLGGTSISQICNSMCYIYNPVNSLYSDNSNIIFTSANAIDRESLNFVIPITGSEYSVKSSGDIRIVVDKSIMVKSIENGVVDEIGVTLDGIKYIKVLHCMNIYSLIENVGIVGVEEGDVIKKGQDIATAREGDVVTLKIFDGDIQLSNIKINQSKIICEN